MKWSWPRPPRRWWTAGKRCVGVFPFKSAELLGFNISDIQCVFLILRVVKPFFFKCVFTFYVRFHTWNKWLLMLKITTLVLKYT